MQRLDESLKQRRTLTELLEEVIVKETEEMKSPVSGTQNLGNKVFVPITDEMIYDHPEKIEGPLVPYAAGMECQEWLSIEINPEDAPVEITSQRDSKSKLSLVYSAI